MNSALEIHVKGIVQGVGFRPFVYRLAKRYLITGWVLNAADGVHIHAEGDEKLLDEFVMELSDNAPAAAQVTEIDLREVPLEPYDSFEIRFSEDEETPERTLVSPDLATCQDCLNELFDPTDRRFRYPFINCTNCGPRFTIIDDLPYDRASTSMRTFKMCETCAAEYTDPADRRFHAQPDACFECGPHIYLSTDGGVSLRWGTTREESDALFAEAVELLRAGKIIAVKGLGGFHLVCDASNPQAIAKLRERKHRNGKPFAVMLPTLEDVAQVCEVGVEEAALLEGSERPIVLLKKRADAAFAAGLADKLPELGVMLPYTPVQHILLHDFAASVCAARMTEEMQRGSEGVECDSAAQETRGKIPSTRFASAKPSTNASSDPLESTTDEQELPPMLVMTSGNLSDEPIVIDDKAAFEKLGTVADAFLGNDRDILVRFDDSVVRVIAVSAEEKAIQFIRRSRGYAPLPIPVSVDAAEAGSGSATVFATGPEQKNTFTLLQSEQPSAAKNGSNDAPEQSSASSAGAGSAGKAFVSQHIGDMEDAETFDAWLQAKSRYEKLFDLHPTALACDLHPEYLTSKWAHEQAERHDLALTQVQHHHAHIVSVMAEHRLHDAVCGIAFDGTGYGADGAIWGGEVLLSNTSDYERFANFAYVPMPGGAACIKHPLRMAYGVLWEYDLLDHPGAAAALAALGAEQAQACETMIEQEINTPHTSSVGRLFDAASALLGVCMEPTYEGEPAILLEAAMEDGEKGEAEEAFALQKSDDIAGKREGVECDSAAPEISGIIAPTDFASAKPSTNASSRFPDNDGQNAIPYTVEVVKNTAGPNSTAQDTSVLVFDAAPVFRALLDDLAAGVSVPVIARRFHDAFVQAIVQAAQLVEALYGITTVVLSGGVFMNRYLMEHALQALEQAGFTVAINRELPPNDGCISLGQAVVAASRLPGGADR